MALLKNNPLVLFAIFTTLFLTVFGSRVFFTDGAVTALVETTPRYCKIFTDRHAIRYIVKVNKNIIYVTDSELEKYKKLCIESQGQNPNGTFTYPGTLWCGPGFLARNFSDLGFHYREDTCCRTHDHCTDFIPSGTCREGLCNPTPYTRSHCNCDNEFKQCLQKVKTETANTIGAIFFNIAKLICFEEDQSCTNTNSINSTCSPYKFVSAGRYSGGRQGRFSIFNKKEFVLNIFLRRFGLL